MSIELKFIFIFKNSFPGAGCVRPSEHTHNALFRDLPRGGKQAYRDKKAGTVSHTARRGLWLARRMSPHRDLLRREDQTPGFPRQPRGS